MECRTQTRFAPGQLVLVLAALLALAGACKKIRPAPNPWARALPRSSAAYGLPAVADAQVTLGRRQLLLSGKPLLRLTDGRLPRTALRDGPDGLFVPHLAQALGPLARKRPDGSASHGRLAISCPPAVPFRTLRAMLYTAMRAGFVRPWLVVEGAQGKPAGLPLELPSVPSDQSHGLRPWPTRTPGLAIGLRRGGIHVTRWGRADCPGGATMGPTGCASLSPGDLGKGLPRLTAHLWDRFRAAAKQPGRRRPPSNAVMVWAGLDVPVGNFVRLLDAAREAPGGTGSCRLVPDDKTHHWKRTSPLLDPRGASNQGCLHYQTVLVWSKPGHRKP